MSTLVSGRNYNIHLDGKTIEFGPNRSQGGAIEGIRFARKNLFLDDLALIKRCVRQFLQPSNDSALITLTNEPFFNCTSGNELTERLYTDDVYL